MTAGELDYGMIGAEGTLEAEPGLWLHVVRIASVQADMALNELLSGTEIYRSMPGNTVILANTRAGNHRRGDQPAVFGGLGDGRTQIRIVWSAAAGAGAGKPRWTTWWK